MRLPLIADGVHIYFKLMRKISVRIFLCIIMLLFISVLYAQDENISIAPETTNTANVNENTEAAKPASDLPKENTVVTPDETKVSNAVSTVKETKPDVNKIKPEESKDDGLLSVADGDYKYERIPDIEIKKSVVYETSKSVEKGYVETAEGKSKKGDIIIKITVILMIIAIIILVRFRSKRGSSSVLRRFPG